MSVDATQLERSALEAKDREELATIATAMGGKPGSRARKGEIIDQILELAGVTPGGSGGSNRGNGDSSADEAAPTDDAKADADAPAQLALDGDDAKAGDAEADGADADAKADDAKAGDADTKADGAERSDAEGDGASQDGDAKSDDAKDDDAKAERSGDETSDQADDAKDEKAEKAERSDDADKSDDKDAEAKDGRAGRSDGEKDGRGDRGPRNRDGQKKDGQKKDGGDGQRNQGGGQNQGGQNQGGGGEPEPGNRRRRRRGRDRDRQGGGQGQDRQGQGGGDDQPFNGEPVPVEGMLDLRDEGYGFLRVKGFLPSKDDVYVSVKQVRQFGLRKGDHLSGASRPASRNEKNPALLRVDKVNGEDPEKMRARPRFEDLTPLFPDEKLALEMPSDPTNMTARIVDLVSPVGKGQRGLIVSPPKAGKTTIMKQIAKSIETNNPEVKLIVLLVDERPEEVTDMRRWISGDVVASTFDRPSDEHTQVAELALERAKRLVEEGNDVVIILDGITRLARAYNLAAPATGRIMSGGIDTGALYPPKKFFGSARNIEEGGSLTILATALVETGSRMDEVIFEEFKGTGNMELRLDRRLADRRIYPAIDVDASSTRHEELLFERKELQQVWKLRRVLSGLGEGGGGAGLELLIDRMKTFKSNDEFLSEIAKAGSGLG
jgi:transcription termination factor Rho